MMDARVETRVLVIACGAIATELAAVARLDGPVRIDVQALPARLHDTPTQIPERVRARVHAARDAGAHDRIVVGYADCGTGGLLDVVCTEEGVERLPGAHCYELFAGAERFAALHGAEPGTFFLTDYLARNFERLVVRTLGLDRHPELRDVYFANYRRVVFLRQSDDRYLKVAAERAADRLGLTLEIVDTGTGAFDHAVSRAVGRRLPLAVVT